MDLKQDLTPAQHAAVTHRDGPLLVVAGAGSGKTRVITFRIAHLLSTGVPARAILAITFTNKAADEMRARIHTLFSGTILREMWVSTFHAFCARILRMEAGRIHFPSNFTIYDARDQERLVKDIIRSFRADTGRFNPAQVLSHISRAKGEFRSAESWIPPVDNPFFEFVSKVFFSYEKALHEANAMDFDDLLLRTARLFQDHADVLDKYSHRFRYVLIDEYQDTNHVQYMIARQISRRHGNICATGDPDQSIYGWRGADIRNILRFEADFPGAQVINLEENFRSTKRILAAADHLIKRNRRRKKRNLYTSGEEGTPLRCVVTGDEREEGRFVAEEVEHLRKKGYHLKDIACLYRTNALSRNIEDALLERGIHYTVIGTVSFYQRREVKDILAYLRIIVNRNDDISLKRIINIPPRRIGTRTVDALEKVAAARGMSLFEAMTDNSAAGELTERIGRMLRNFNGLIDSIAEEGTTPVKEVIHRIIDRIRYREYLMKDRDSHVDERLANLDELMNAAARHDMEGRPGSGLVDFLENVSLVSDIDGWENEEGQMSLMTLHNAKGLEFPVVFLIGMEEGLFPHIRSMNDEFQVEEERRLCYVGITRARKELYLSRADTRMFQGSPRQNRPSRFIREIPDTVKEERIYPVQKSARPSRQGVMPSSERSATVNAPSSAAGETYAFRTGDRVRHRQFGAGRIVKIHGREPLIRVTVMFEKSGEKTLVLRYAALTKV
jgi:DNA helicase-2/ATP-dependent DNA helicase PcrA